MSAMMYVIGSIIGPIAFRNMPPKKLVCLSCFISMIAMNITGPSTLLSLPHDFNLLLSGMLLMCLSANFFVQVCLPEVMDYCLVKYRIVPGSNPTVDGKLTDV